MSVKNAQEKPEQPERKATEDEADAASLKHCSASRGGVRRQQCPATALQKLEETGKACDESPCVRWTLKRATKDEEKIGEAGGRGSSAEGGQSPTQRSPAAHMRWPGSW